MAWAAAKAGSPKTHDIMHGCARRGGAIALMPMMVVSMTIAWSQAAHADEGGVSFWVPGLFGSLAAAPQQPGWSFTTIFYNTDVRAGADVAFARQVHRGNINVPFTGNLNINLKADAPLQFFLPSYTFAEPLLGGQATFLLLGAYGRNQASVDG